MMRRLTLPSSYDLRRYGLIAVVAVAALALGLVGLEVVAGDDDGRISASATFDDVADMAVGAPVMMADVTVGKVTSIALADDGRRARLELSIDRSAQVPAEVVARVRRTTPLGEKFVDLAPQTDDLEAPLLEDGATIAETEVVSDLEQLVASGTSSFGALSASQLAILLDEGDKAFGGKGPQLRQVLDQLSSVAAGYETRTDEITAIIGDLDQLAGDLAPAVDANGEALANLKDTMAVLLDNDERFFDLARSLSALADDGNRLLERHQDQITRQLRALRDVTDAIADEQDALGGVLEQLPRHNQNVPLAERSNFIHVLIDIVLCGLPGGGDVPGDPVDACEPGAS